LGEDKNKKEGADGKAGPVVKVNQGSIKPRRDNPCGRGGVGAPRAKGERNHPCHKEKRIVMGKKWVKTEAPVTDQSTGKKRGRVKEGPRT